jgi:hypothetical protein
MQVRKFYSKLTENRDFSIKEETKGLPKMVQTFFFKGSEGYNKILQSKPEFTFGLKIP